MEKCRSRQLASRLLYAIEGWRAAPRTTPGGQPWYSPLAILTALTLKTVFRLALRQTEGLTAGSGQIVAASLTAKEVDDGAAVGPLLDQITGAVASFTGDGGYDQDRIYADVAEHSPRAAVVVPPRATAVPSETAETAPTQRDRHLHHIAEHGRMAWQKAFGYTMRARAEAAIGRFKQVIGDGLRSRMDDRRATEVDIAVQALNCMVELGRPNYVRIA